MPRINHSAQPLVRTTYRYCNYDVIVPFEHLDNLPCLEIPEVHFVVLAPRDDPFPARYTETRCDAEFVVDMTYVCLQTARALVVPKPDGAIMGGGEDVLGVGRELHVLAMCV